MIQRIYIPKTDDTLSISTYTLIVLTKGSGVLQVDFQNYHFLSGKGLFLAPGQYLKLISGYFEISLYEFEGDRVAQMEDSRYLFKHLVSLGHIDINPIRKPHSSSFQILEMKADDQALLDVSINRWLGLNPFGASKPEVNMLFDIKDFIDANYRQTPRVEEVAVNLQASISQIKNLTKKKLETTVNRLTQRKLLLESQRMVAFTHDSTKSIAYELGFNHPTYFNRFFRQQTARTPGDFREDFHFQVKKGFMEDFEMLLNQFFKEEHFMSFYANKLHMSVKSLSRRINTHFGCSFYQLLSDKLIEEAKNQLSLQNSITDISYGLGFKEPNHLTTFFKKHTGTTPSAYLA